MSRVPPTPDDELSELASAYLDGEATPNERARVEADLLARVAELQTVRDLLAAPVPSGGAAARESAIATALGQLAPVDLAARRASRRPGRIALAVLGAAAAGAIAVAAVATTTRSSKPSSASLATEAASARDVATAAAGAATTAAGGGSFSTTTSAVPATTAGATTTAAAASTANGDTTPPKSAPSPAVPDLGEVDSAAALRSVLGAEQTGSRLAPTVAPLPNACNVPSGQLVGTLTWQGTPALLFVTDNTGGTVVSRDGCQTLVVVPLT